ncbi:ABC transporter substrate-binding protein [Longispora fulva]|uniref:Simple sugar transport system substrate-binding protein/ribose transport system substrate-binding protein n=1 Tax=Longispora fulva TaxID=619741 RepID=A0A8J7GS41_9ACTN|nr:sugar ABC transporter substrate-binding protein [Longispora fulva]MBG6137669.1 simple sugar transport system substrate-binding protein/ribose transport system substrate-binding protein [Longispora fulva]GIG62172.1 ABC transporter substrate-binding protein [Longispora fulva]
MKRIATAVLAAVALVVTGCGTSTDKAGSGGSVVGVDYPRSDSDFWNSYIKYAPEQAKALGLDLKTSNSENDVAKLAANIQALISQGVKGVVMAPQDTAAIAPTLDQLKAKKIPVVTVDTRPDVGDVFMVVRADNRAYGTKACQFLGKKLEGKGKVAMLQGDLASINGRDRTEAFNDCMKKDFPNVQVIGLATDWKGDVAANKLQTTIAANPDLKGIYMQAGGVFLNPTIQVLKQKGMLVPPSDPKHVFIVSNDGIPQELKAIADGDIDATVSQPADLYAKWALFYVKAAIDGKTFQLGATDHDSTIVGVRPGLMEDQLPAPLVTKDGSFPGSKKSDDPALWGNQIK